MAGTLNPQAVSTEIERIAKLARQMPGAPLRTLAHHIDIEWMKEAHQRVRKDGATGVDGQTAAEYGANLQSNLQSLLDRAKSGDHYRAPPVRRVHIPKGDGSKTRPIGIPTFEDKVLQKAVAMVLEAVYEQSFLDCSYGFRPGRGAHDALQAVWKHTMDIGGWVLEADIEKFFDSVDRAKLQEVLSRRVHDGVLIRLIGKWLKAGVMEGGVVYRPDTGTPQGGVISPLLANIFLHEVLDTWWQNEVQPRLRGRSALVRYADDFVMVIETEEDARRVAAVLPKRFEKYGLKLHPEKTRLIRFERPGSHPPPDGGKGRSGSFDLLGFTHYWDRSRKGGWVVRRKTAKDRLSRTLRRINVWCRDNRHSRIGAQHAALSRKLRGHDAYYGITGNYRALDVLRLRVTEIWRKWLHRRSWKGRVPWDDMNRLLERFPLPRARVVHSTYRVANP